MPEPSPAKRRRRAIQILRRLCTEIEENQSSYHAVVVRHQFVARSLMAVVSTEVVGTVLPEMATEGAEWDQEAYDEIHRIVDMTISPLTTALANLGRQINRDQQKLLALRAGVTSLQTTVAEITQQCETTRDEVAIAQSQLTAIQAELNNREQAFLAFLRRTQPLRLKADLTIAIERRLISQLGSLEERRRLVERDRDEAKQLITSLETDLQEFITRQVQLQRQIAEFESNTANFLMTPFGQQIKSMRISFTSTQKQLQIAVRKLAILATKQQAGQGFLDWISDCERKRSAAVALVNTETKTLSESEVKLQTKIIESVVKTKERELERQRLAKERQREEREAERRQVERRAQAAERRRLAAERRRRDAQRQLRAPRSPDLRPGEPDLNELRRTFRNS